jgi:hypothetical protein
MRALLASALLSFAIAAHAQERLPIFDAHLHYSHDAWESVPVQDAIAIMRKAGRNCASTARAARSAPGSATRR